MLLQHIVACPDCDGSAHDRQHVSSETLSVNASMFVIYAGAQGVNIRNYTHGSRTE